MPAQPLIPKAPTIARYGFDWPADYRPIEVEMNCIQMGGRWKQANGNWAGMGLYHHYRELDKILWPKIKRHRWDDLLLRSCVDHNIVGVLGPANSGKSNFMARWALLNYFCYPNDSTILVSSTDLRGLELRIWGEIKKLWRSAKKIIPVLPGNILEARIMITTEGLADEEARDFRNGIIGIPCIVNQSFIGLSKFVGVKNTRVMLLGDECFPAGTLVDTPHGRVAIEKIRVGDVVVSAIGPNRVLHIGNRQADSLVRIRTRDGREIVCTPNHKVLTSAGWVKSIDLKCGAYMISPYEAMQAMRETNQKQTILRSILHREVHADRPSSKGEVLHQGKGRKNIGGEKGNAPHSPRDSSSFPASIAVKQSDARPLAPSQDSSSHESGRMQAPGTWRKRTSSNRSRGSVAGAVPGCEMELRGNHQDETRIRNPNVLQAGLGIPRDKTGRGSRWHQSRLGRSKASGSAQGCISHGAWVESVEVLKQEGLNRYRNGKAGITVYNLQVEGHASYSVNGLVVSNCQFMQVSWLDAISNLANNPWFHCIGAGNPKDPTDCLGKFCEPSSQDGGWEGVDQAEKTKTWRTKFFNGICVNLVGTDSPNFDVPEGVPVPFPFLIGRQKIKEVIEFFGKDSIQYWMNCVGMMRQNVIARRVITKMMCVKFRAMELPDWEGPKTKVLGLDAAYGNIGGDRCALTEMHFGKDTNGVQVICFIDRPIIVPVTVMMFKKSQEEQIVDYVSTHAKERGIPPENVFYDATGRGTLAMAFARLWSNAVVGVEFGGKASERPVSKEVKLRCCDHYASMVTELWFSVRYAIESGQMRGLPDEVIQEGIMREWSIVQGNKVAIEPKQDTKTKLGRSPDLFDSLVVAVEGARQRGFQINALGTEAMKQQALKWLQDMKERYQSLKRSKSLTHA